MGMGADDVIFQRIISGYNAVGFGVELLYHDWDQQSRELDLDKLKEEFERTKPIVEKWLRQYGITQEVKLYMQTDYC